MSNPPDPNIVIVDTGPGDAPDHAGFIRRRLDLVTLPFLPAIRLYLGRPDSGIGRYCAEHNAGRAPYWAYPWSGGMVLAAYLRDHSEAVVGKRVLDLGAGGGVVAVAAARAGATTVTAAETDPLAAVALALNAEANGVGITIVTDDLLAGPPPPVDIVLAGDVFYAPDVAKRSAAFLTRCREAGIEVLVGDPGRADLPLQQLTLLASYDVPEVGGARTAATTAAAVYAFG